MFEIYNNKIAFLNKKPKQVKYLLIIILIILLVGIFMITKTKIYSNYRTKGYVLCEETCEIITMIPTNISYDKLTINNELLDLSIINREVVIDETSMESYYKIYFQSTDKYLNQEILDINFYYDKESLFTKIKEKLF
jgi:hypothetical protein